MKVKILSWNVQGLNRRNKRSTLKSLIRKWGVDINCLHETKIENWNVTLHRQIWGIDGVHGLNYNHVEAVEEY